MPNHVTSICTVTGPAADVTAFVERHIVPVPCDEHTDCKTSPTLAAACTVAGSNQRHFDFNTIIPMPVVLEGTVSPSRGDEHNRRAEAETGFSNWYDWAIAKWGTKWGAYDYEERERDDGRFVFKFETAWSFPRPVFEALADLHPRLIFDLVTYDEGDIFGGEGQFNGRNDFCVTKELATPEMYKRVYGEPYPSYEDDP